MHCQRSARSSLMLKPVTRELFLQGSSERHVASASLDSSSVELEVSRFFYEGMQTNNICGRPVVFWTLRESILGLQANPSTGVMHERSLLRRTALGELSTSFSSACLQTFRTTSSGTSTPDLQRSRIFAAQTSDEEAVLTNLPRHVASASLTLERWG